VLLSKLKITKRTENPEMDTQTYGKWSCRKVKRQNNEERIIFSTNVRTFGFPYANKKTKKKKKKES
jgi:hypothetical protein